MEPSRSETPAMEWKSVPSLSHALTTRCNLRCEYCPPYGDSLAPGARVGDRDGRGLDVETAIAVWGNMADLGARVVRVTGGEPLKELAYLSSLMHGVHGLSKVNVMRKRLNTNGVLLAECVDVLSGLGFDCIKVSLDSVRRSQFAEIAGSDRLDDVLRGIDACLAHGMRVELNAVITRKTRETVWEIVEYAIEHKVATLKLLDLYLIDDEEYWQMNYVDLASVCDELAAQYGPPSVMQLSDRRGSPMSEFRASEHTRVLVKDSSKGATYSREMCPACPRYPCHNGVLTVTLTDAGELSPCHLRPDLAVRLSERLAGLRPHSQGWASALAASCTEVFVPFSRLYASSEFFESIERRRGKL